MNIKFMAVVAALLLAAPFSWAGGNKDQAPAPASQTGSSATQTPAVSASPYFTGDGGKGRSITILPPRGVGLAANQAYLPDFVANELVSNFGSFSAMTLFDRVNNQKQYDELLSGFYADDDKAGLDLGHLSSTDYMLLGDITKTSTGFALQLTVNRNSDKTTVASYSQTLSIAELDNLTGVRRASLDLLQKMGVQLTAQAQTELGMAATTERVNAQTAMAQGIAAHRQGTEVTALSYYFQAAAFDSSLAEAANRSSVLSRQISSGNIGEDVRNEIQWRRDWVARLTETEQYFNNFVDNFFRTASMPYILYYSTEITRGAINFQAETTTLSIEARLRPSQEWVRSVEPAFRAVQATVQAINNGLNATGRKAAWGLNNWPEQGGFNLQRFGRQSKSFSVIIELVNDRNQVIGRQTLQTGGTYEIPVPLPGRNLNFSVSADDKKTVSFANVRANDITDSLTIRIAGVNGQNAEAVARSGVLQIMALTGEQWETYVTLEGKGVDVWGKSVIGDKAFYAQQLTSVTIPDGVGYIGSQAFAVNQLTSVIIGAGVTSIENSAFNGCTGLTSVTIGTGITTIGQFAFQNCTSLTGITIPAGVTTIDQWAFNGCTGLASITVDSNNQNYASESGVLYNKAKTSFVLVPKAISGSVTIPATITTVTGFIDCANLTGVTIPASATSIGYAAFENCTGLTSITIPASVTTLGNRAFLGCTNLARITFGAAGLDLSGSGGNATVGNFAAYYADNGGAGTYTTTAPVSGSSVWVKE